MAYDLSEKMVIGVSSRALFDLTAENEIFEKQGLEAYCRYQVEHEQEVLRPGPGFELIKALLQLNGCTGKRDLIEVIIMSHNSPDTSLRVFNTIAYYGLPITRSVLASGASLAPYLAAFGTDLFLSACEADVQSAIDSGIAAGIICTEGIHTRQTAPDHACAARHTRSADLGHAHAARYVHSVDSDHARAARHVCSADSDHARAVRHAHPVDSDHVHVSPVDGSRRAGRESEIIPMPAAPVAAGQIRIAFDGDAVLFTDESELIFQEKGLNAFEENERAHAGEPLAEGPFASFLRKLSDLQRELGTENCPIRTALVTSRSAPAHERVIRTMRAWNVRVDEAFFLGGLEKKEFLKAFGAQIFFDDQSVHTQSAAQAVPAARVPYRRKGTLYRLAR